MSEIKPKMVDGEPRCDRRCDAENQLKHDHYCSHAKHDDDGFRAICWPYYRQALAAAEEGATR